MFNFIEYTLKKNSFSMIIHLHKNLKQRFIRIDLVFSIKYNNIRYFFVPIKTRNRGPKKLLQPSFFTKCICTLKFRASHFCILTILKKIYYLFVDFEKKIANEFFNKWMTTTHQIFQQASNWVSKKWLFSTTKYVTFFFSYLVIYHDTFAMKFISEVYIHTLMILYFYVLLKTMIFNETLSSQW